MERGLGSMSEASRDGREDCHGSATGAGQFAFDLELQRHLQVLKETIVQFCIAPFGEECWEAPTGFKSATPSEQ